MMIILAALGLAGNQCAKPGAPTGGPKDETPPRVLMENPPNHSIHFNARKVTITFDEFITLKDPVKEIFISPPMRNKPVFKTQGKRVVIEFKEDFRPDATYTLNFGNAITDFTEGNALVNYEYVFSTGDHIDSLFIRGSVLNAFDHKPEEGVIAMVYTNDNDTLALDSLPLYVQPMSASRTIKDGSFRINNLPPGEYLLFALQDMNNNYIFDLPNEKIAFLDSLVVIAPPAPAPLPAPDFLDTAMQEPPAIQIVDDEKYIMYLFEEKDPAQKLISKTLLNSNHLRYIFRRPADSVEISLTGSDEVKDKWYIPEFTRMRDTLDLYLLPGLADTIRVALSAGTYVTDTTRFIRSRSMPEPLMRRRDAGSDRIRIASNLRGGVFDIDKEFRFIFPLPVVAYDSSRIILASENDTLSPMVYFTDSIRRTAVVYYKFQPGESYKVTALDSAFTDLAGNVNDSTPFSFRVRTVTDYGQLVMNIMLPEETGQYIIQQMTDKEVILQEKIITHSGPVAFENLMPGTYKFKAIADRNANGIWDTGNYRQKILPEWVEYIPAPITIRANWDLAEEWTVRIK
ncbi:MAG: Ig-like domain-containing protein [Bacteroidales bacterium]|nr:Ig-like domain-containing protein [Bacteroidales bacterium]